MRTQLVLPFLALLLAFGSGCKVLPPPNEEEQQEIEHKRQLPTEVRCHALEYDHETKERPRPRTEAFDRVEFVYTSSNDIQQTLGASGATHVFLIVHGWMNDATSSQKFSSRWVNGVRARAQAGDKLAFVSIHWDSERVNFRESAETAIQIGKRRIAPVLEATRAALPNAQIVVIGHSLGARLMIAALHHSAERYANAAVLVEGAADLDWLHGKMHNATRQVEKIANVYSIHDSVLEKAYFAATAAKALGRYGAERISGSAFAEINLSTGVDGLGAAFQGEASLGKHGARVVNINASGIVKDHTDIDHAELYEVVWAVSR